MLDDSGMYRVRCNWKHVAGCHPSFSSQGQHECEVPLVGLGAVTAKSEADTVSL